MTRHTRHTAFGQRCVVLYPEDFDLTGQSYPALGQEWKSPTLDFDETILEYVNGDVRMPMDRIPGTLIIPKLWFFPDDIPNGQQGTQTVWRMIIHAMRIGDYLSTNVAARSAYLEGVSPGVLGADFATEVSFTNLEAGSGKSLHTQVDSPGPNGRPNLQIELWRVSDDGRDTMPNDAKFLKLMFFYTARS